MDADPTSQHYFETSRAGEYKRNLFLQTTIKKIDKKKQEFTKVLNYENSQTMKHNKKIPTVTKEKKNKNRVAAR